jgi:hypothetical protein
MCIQIHKDKSSCSSTTICGRSPSLFADARPQTIRYWQMATGSNTGLLQRSIIERKGINKQHSMLENSESVDKYERGADMVANRILRRSSPVVQVDQMRELREPSSSP